MVIGKSRVRKLFLGVCLGRMDENLFSKIREVLKVVMLLEIFFSIGSDLREGCGFLV